MYQYSIPLARSNRYKAPYLGHVDIGLPFLHRWKASGDATRGQLYARVLLMSCKMGIKDAECNALGMDVMEYVGLPSSLCDFARRGHRHVEGP